MEYSFKKRASGGSFSFSVSIEVDRPIIFAFGPKTSYIYQTTKGSGRRNLPAALEELYQKELVREVRCAAFGTSRESYFLSFIDPQGRHRQLFGSQIPSKLRSYLYDAKTKRLRRNRQVQVVLGPDDSFFAWDSNSIRWDNIPEDLEESVQEWLSPAGWKVGPPRMLSLGFDGSYFAVSEYGTWVYDFPDHFDEVNDLFDEWVDKRFDFRELLLFSLHPCRPGHFVAVTESRDVRFLVDPSAEADFMAFGRSLKGKARTESNSQQPSGSGSHSYFDHRRRATTGSIPIHESREAQQKAQASRAYALWKTQCDSLLKSTTPLTTFPVFPEAICICVDVSCRSRKDAEGSIAACKHDVERLLRGSDRYSYEFLRKERLTWHPDRFSLRCDPDAKIELVKKTTELYSIFEELIREEKGRRESAG